MSRFAGQIHFSAVRISKATGFAVVVFLRRWCFPCKRPTLCVFACTDFWFPISFLTTRAKVARTAFCAEARPDSRSAAFFFLLIVFLWYGRGFVPCSRFKGVFLANHLFPLTISLGSQGSHSNARDFSPVSYHTCFLCQNQVLIVYMI
jgi:hypothetical protein